MMHPWPHTLLLVLLFSVHGLAQAADPEMDPVPLDGSLPNVLETTYSDGMTWSTEFELPAGASERVKVHAWFDNMSDEERIFLEYFVYKDVGGDQLFTSKRVSYTAPYRVTAACRAAGGSDNRLFLAGWSERTRSVHIEEWTLQLGAIGAATNGQGDPILTFVPPNVLRETVWTSNTLAPVEDMVFHDVSGALLLLEYGPSSRLYQLSTQSGSLVLLMDSAIHADFAKVSDIRLSVHAQHGYVFHGRDLQEWSFDTAAWYLVMTDSNGDGVFESPLVRYEADAFATAFPVSGWIYARTRSRSAATR